MRWTFGDDDFQRGPNMRLAEVARHGMSIAFADHDMKMEGRLAVQLGDVAQQGCYLHLLAHRNLRVILLLPIEVLKHNVACRMAVLSALHEPTASRPVSGYPSERHSLFFGFATLGGLRAALFRSTMKRVEDGRSKHPTIVRRWPQQSSDSCQ